MFVILIQALVLILLLGGVAWGYRRLVRPLEASLDRRSKHLLALIVLTGVGGLLGSLFWWADDPRSFAWDLPPLASRLLAAAGCSFAAGCLLALRSLSPQQLRLALILLVTYLAPLVLAIFVSHLDRFDFATPLTYAFFLIAGGMAVAALWYLIRPPAIIRGTDEHAAPASILLRVWFILIAAVTAPWGAALFIADSGPMPLIWVWPGDLLTSRLIAVMLLTIALAAVSGLRSAATAVMALGMALVYGAGVALACLWNALSGSPIPMLYLGVFGGIFLGSALALALSRTAGELRVKSSKFKVQS
jgi:hypothetical protein